MYLCSSVCHALVHAFLRGLRVVGGDGSTVLSGASDVAVMDACGDGGRLVSCSVDRMWNDCNEDLM